LDNIKVYEIFYCTYFAVYIIHPVLASGDRTVFSVVLFLADPVTISDPGIFNWTYF